MNKRQWIVGCRTKLFFYGGLLAIAAGFSSLVSIFANGKWLLPSSNERTAQEVALLIFLLGFVGELVAGFSFLSDNSSRKQRPRWTQ